MIVEPQGFDAEKIWQNYYYGALVIYPGIW